MSKHTPGPWTAHMVNTATVNIRAGKISVANVSRHIGSPVLNDRDGEGDGNAALVAAAPELLEAAKNLLSYLPESSDDFQNKLEAALVAAIAKAEG